MFCLPCLSHTTFTNALNTFSDVHRESFEHFLSHHWSINVFDFIFSSMVIDVASCMNWIESTSICYRNKQCTSFSTPTSISIHNFLIFWKLSSAMAFLCHAVLQHSHGSWYAFIERISGHIIPVLNASSHSKYIATSIGK